MKTELTIRWGNKKVIGDFDRGKILFAVGSGLSGKRIYISIDNFTE